MAKEKTYELNKVEGFNPYDYVEPMTTRKGDPILKKDGTQLEYLKSLAKVVWFRKVKPEGSLPIVSVEDIPLGDDFKIIRVIVSVYGHVNDALPLADGTAQETIWDSADYDTALNRVVTIARGRALKDAGFGCEIELELGAVSEGESSENIAPAETPSQEVIEKKKRGRPKKAETPEVSEETVEADVASMLSAIEEASKPEEPEATPVDDEEMKKALATKLECTDSAPLNIRKFEGKTLEEIMNEHENFCTLVKTRPNIKKAVSEETLKAATYIADHKK